MHMPSLRCSTSRGRIELVGSSAVDKQTYAYAQFASFDLGRIEPALFSFVLFYISVHGSTFILREIHAAKIPFYVELVSFKCGW